MNGSRSGQVNGTSGTQTSMEQGNLETIVFQNEANLASSFDATGSNSSVDFSNFPKTINDGKQGKHIQGHNNYQLGRSTLTISVQEAQELVNTYSGKGEKVSDNKERVDFGKVIGNYVDPSTEASIPTTVGMIHYSESGTHIVPARPNDQRKMRKNDET